MSEEEIYYTLGSIRFAILCHDYGKLDAFIQSGNVSPCEDFYSCFLDALCAAADFIAEDYMEDYNAEKYYISFESMMEYYRLCRDYCTKFGVRLKKNPYMIEAQRFVDRVMYFSGGGYSYLLNTKINHKWASGILIGIDYDTFNDELELVDAMFAINEWYQEGVERLKKELNAPKTELLAA